MGKDGTLAIADMLRTNNTLQHLIIDLDKDTSEEARFLSWKTIISFRLKLSRELFKETQI